MTTIFWKTAAPFGTCRSRYKARRAAAIAERQREKRLIRKIGHLLGQEECARLSLNMRSTFAAGHSCPHCALPGPGNPSGCSFCAAFVQQAQDR